MKIAIFRTDTSIVRTDSYNSQEIGLSRGFAEHGHSVDVYSITSEKEASTIAFSDNRCIEFTFLPAYVVPVLEFPIYRNLKNIIYKNKYDVVQINEEGNLASLYIAYLCKKNNIPFCIYQGMYVELSGRSRALYESFHHKLIRPWLARNASKIFSKTSQAKEFLIAREYKDVKVIGVGLDEKPFQDAQAISWRDELGIDASLPLILYVGTLEQRRNPDLLLDIAARLKEAVHVIVVGQGPEFERISTRLKNESIANVSLLGKLPQRKLPSLYQQCSVLLLPSSYEIFGMVVLEALWFGVPVLSTRTAGPTDVISDSNFGEIIESLELDPWVRAIERQIAKNHDEKSRAILQKNARDRFNWKAIAATYLEELPHISQE